MSNIIAFRPHPMARVAPANRAARARRKPEAFCFGEGRIDADGCSIALMVTGPGSRPDCVNVSVVGRGSKVASGRLTASQAHELAQDLIKAADLIEAGR